LQEEISTGEQLLTQCIPRLSVRPLHVIYFPVLLPLSPFSFCLWSAQNTLALIEAHNALGVVWSNRDAHTKAHGFLESSEKLYHSARAARNSLAAAKAQDAKGKAIPSSTGRRREVDA
jgi:hypothetical protein